MSYFSVWMFAKIFQSMYDGSLAQRGPWEALVTFQQFLILADRFGDVDIHPEVISRRTLIPLDVIMKGIGELSKPDEFSRDPSEEGRRIVPLSATRAWGWHIVNYTKYSQIRSAEERRESRAKHYQETKAKDIDAGMLQRFERFWNVYPRKVSKQHALKSWLKISPDEALANTIISSLNEQKESQQWTKDNGQFIPHPTTWLNRKGWLDEAPTKPQLGKCEYCERPAIAITKGHRHCEVARHRDHAEGRC